MKKPGSQFIVDAHLLYRGWAPGYRSKGKMHMDQLGCMQRCSACPRNKAECWWLCSTIRFSQACLSCITVRCTADYQMWLSALFIPFLSLFVQKDTQTLASSSPFPPLSVQVGILLPTSPKYVMTNLGINSLLLSWTADTSNVQITQGCLSSAVLWMESLQLRAVIITTRYTHLHFRFHNLCQSCWLLAAYSSYFSLCPT